MYTNLGIISFNDQGEILLFCVTSGNADDRKPLLQLAKFLTGKLFGDRGYVSKELTQLLVNHDMKLITMLIMMINHKSGNISLPKELRISMI